MSDPDHGKHALQAPPINTVIQRRVENPTSGSVTSYPGYTKIVFLERSEGTVTSYPDQSGTLVKLQIFRRAGALL